VDFVKSQELFEKAKKNIPGGVNSPVRAYKSVNMTPLFISKGEGAYIFDEDGNKYIDYVSSYGPLILGHVHPAVKNALEKCLQNGTSFGAPTELENEIAHLIVDAVPSIEMVRMVNSGTEATMSALRLARAYTGRKKIIKFEGCYHGHADLLLIKAGSGALTHGVPTSPGVPKEITDNTLIAPYNDASALEELIKNEGAENIAAVILEPVAGNMGCIPPLEGYLEKVRKITSENGIVLIFDEVMSGFRVAYGCAQKRYNIKPDITCLGKIIGGGLPVGAYGGKKEIMKMVSPIGPVYQAGTLSGNPMAMTAGITTLKELQKEGVYEELEDKTQRLVNGIKDAAEKADVKICLNSVGAMFSFFFTDKEVIDFKTASSADINIFKAFFKKMLCNGIYFAPSPFETAFMSLAHSNEDVEKTIEIFHKVLKEIIKA
jgi:glutamate-1-semialdehyde 2,1-aminomutase